MDQRTRERLPVLPALVRSAAAGRDAAAARLAACTAARPGETFTAGGQELRRAIMAKGETARTWAEDPASGSRRDLTLEEHRAFWAWAAIEVLRHTGIRIEELTELSHHSLVQYRLPPTGELIPLLQIVPSKTDAERLLVISPELAGVLSAIITRIRGTGGAVPLVVSYDDNEKVWNPPMPLLFQRRLRSEDRPVTAQAIRELLNIALDKSGLTGAAGQPLRFAPHDFRRMLITDAIMHGMPPHIAQLVAGHRDISTTMGYKAVYPEEVISGHRAFIARRRALLPAAEYRVPTDDEWAEFLGLPINCTSSGSSTGRTTRSAERVRRGRGRTACADGGAGICPGGGGGAGGAGGAVAVLRREQRRRGTQGSECLSAGLDARRCQPADLP
jgi:integrase